MIEITFKGEDFAELREQAGVIFRFTVPSPSIGEQLTLGAETAGAVGAVGAVDVAKITNPIPTHTVYTNGANPPVAKRPPGRPRKESLPPVMNHAPTQEELREALEIPHPAVKAEPAKEPSLEETKFAVNKVLEAKGVKTAHECIKHFGANRITELDKAKWPMLIKHCEAQL